MSIKNVLLLGAAGQLGYAVADIVPDSVNLTQKTRKDLDITDSQSLANTLKFINPDVVINCAAYTAVDAAEDEVDQAYAINAEGIANLANIVPEATRIIHISTDFVFSKPTDHPYLPTDEVSPISAYGKSKLKGESLLTKIHGNNSVILRTSWLYSATGKNFVKTMLRLMASRSTLDVVNDQFGSPTSVDSLAIIIWQFIQIEEVQGIYHWSDHGVISWYDFAIEIYEQAREIGLLNQDVTIKPVTTREYPTPARRPAYSALDSSATEALLNVKSPSWQSELAKVLSQIKELKS